MEDRFLFYLAGVPILGILAQWLAWRFRLPSILLLLCFGIILGQVFHLDPDSILESVINQEVEIAETESESSESGTELEEIEANVAEAESETASENPSGDGKQPKLESHSVAPRLLFPFITLSVAIILFEGGLSLKISELRDAGSAVFKLVTIGALIGWILTTILAKYLFGFTYFRLAALVGAVLIVTGPTVVAPLLRHIRPSRTVSSVIKWEGIVIDPIGAILAVLVFEFAISAEGDKHTIGHIFYSLFMCTVVASGIGVAFGLFMIKIVRRFQLPDFLHTVTFFATVLAAFAFANWLYPESGLVTVTVFGIVLANQKTISIDHIVEFKESLGVLLISCLFIILGSRVELADLAELGWQGIVFLLLLIIVVRPVAVAVSMIGSKLNWRERVFISCLAPRGIVAAAVTAVFALKVESLIQVTPEWADMQADAERLVPITFLVIIGTVAIYGLGASPLAKWLKLSDDSSQGILFAGADDVIQMIAKRVKDAGFRVLLVDTNYQNVSSARVDGIPAECMSVLSERVYEDIDFSGLGRMLAMTPNDEVNAMATDELRHFFGRANVFRLPTRDGRSGKRASVSEHSEGRILFGKNVSHTHLGSLIDQGWVVKNTKLTEAFTLEHFRTMYGREAVILFSIDGQGRLHVVTMDDETKFVPGMTLIAIVDPERSENVPAQPEKLLESEAGKAEPEKGSEE